MLISTLTKTNISGWLSDGYETTGIIRKNETGLSKHVLIIAMTANAMKGSKDDCLKVGMDDYVSKPVKMATLDKLPEKWFGQHAA